MKEFAVGEHPLDCEKQHSEMIRAVIKFDTLVSLEYAKLAIRGNATNTGIIVFYVKRHIIWNELAF